MIGGSPVYNFCVFAVRTFYRVIGGVTSLGVENIPKSGPVILAPNHMSHLDPPIAVIGQNRHMWVMAKEELFHNKIFGALIRMTHAYPLKRGASDTESIRKTLAFLESGDGVIMFPEGTRGDGVHLLPLNKGIAMLAKKSGATVIPVGINGTQIVMPKGAKGKRHRMTIAYGQGFTYDEAAGDGNNAEGRDHFMKALEEGIITACATAGLTMLPPEEPSASRTS